eukprot:355127-Chlamydomonas_euryale.AAC.19
MAHGCSSAEQLTCGHTSTPGGRQRGGRADVGCADLQPAPPRVPQSASNPAAVTPVSASACAADAPACAASARASAADATVMCAAVV